MTDFIKLAFNQGKDGIVICNMQEEVIEYNQQAKNLLENSVLDVASADLPSANVIKYKGDGSTPYKKKELPMIQALQGVFFSDCEMLISYQGRKSPIFLSISGGPIEENGKIVGGIISFRSMKMRNAQKFSLEVLSADLKIKNTALEQAEKCLRGLTEKISLANKSLANSNQELTNFAMRVAHDLKAPLFPISGCIELLMIELEEHIGPKERDFFEKILVSCECMRHLIDNLLDYSKFDPNKIKVKDVDLAKVVSEVVQSLELSFKQANASLKIDPLPKIKADPVQSRNLFHNLISNSLKYRKLETPLVVKIGFNAEKSEISIKDNGIGFDNSNALKIFSPLIRLHNSEVDGHGLGLAMCKNIANSQGWDIRAKGLKNEGAEFTIKLNIRKNNT